MNTSLSDPDHSEPERLCRAEIQQRQWRGLRSLLEAIVPANPFWTCKFRQAGVGVSDVRTLDELQFLPFVTKAELIADQRARPAYGTNLTYDMADYIRMHQTSGTTGHPLCWLDTPISWQWFLDCWAQIYRLAGFRHDDRFFFGLSFGPFTSAWAAFEGTASLGNLCLTGGGLGSQARLQMIEANEVTVVCCTPTVALRLAEEAERNGIDLPAGSVRAMIVTGEAGGSIPMTRKRIESAWGARLFDHWGMTEAGCLAVECVENQGGLHLLETECIAEIIDPKTLESVEAGRVGELVVTNLGRIGSPSIRYRTGDLVRADRQACPCGRELVRLEGGIVGRTDDSLEE